MSIPLTPTTETNEELQEKRYRELFTDFTPEFRFHFWYNGATTKHSHDFFEIFIILHGKIKHIHNGEENVLSENCLCLIRPGDIHQFIKINDEPTVQFNVSMTPQIFHSICELFSESLYQKLCGESGLIHLILRDEEKTSLSQLLSLLHSTDETHKELHLSIVKTFIVNSLLYLQTSLKSDKVYPAWFAEFLSKIHTPEYFLQPVHALYNLVPYSQPRLNAYFHEFIGCTLVSYVTKFKLNYACNLLRYSNYSILQIAQMSAYNNLSHFNHTFKKYIGCSPKQYRTRYLKHE